MRESVQIAKIYNEIGDFKLVREKVVAENLLQYRTVSTGKRICHEVMSRLKTLNENEIRYLVGASDKDQAYLLWIAVCYRYRFIAEFAVEVLRERYMVLKSDLTYSDFDFYFDKKSEWHPELEKIRPATRKKLRQVLFRILREANLLTEDCMIKTAILSPNLVEIIQSKDREAILYFPVFESDLKGTTK